MCSINPRTTKSTARVVAWKIIKEFNDYSPKEYTTFFQATPITPNKTLKAKYDFSIINNTIHYGVSAFVYKKDAVEYINSKNEYYTQSRVMRVVIPKDAPRVYGEFDSYWLNKYIPTIISNIQELGKVIKRK
jgi:hypothetical protein